MRISHTRIRRLALMLLALPGDAIAQRAEVSGRVVDGNQQPVPFANIEVVSQGRYVADDSGQFSVRVFTGSVVVNVRRLGYQPVSTSLQLERDTIMEFVMQPMATMLAGQQIAARAITRLSNIGFYTRLRDRERGMNSGWFITPDDIEARHPLETSQLLGSIPGMRLQGGLPESTTGCLMEVFLDGAPVDLRYSGTRGRGALDNLIGVSSVAGIEIYTRSSTVPARFQRLNGACGIVAIWTK